MPQWRKLHTKATDSLDINDMPDDFHRLLWVLLPLGLDREGRGLDNPAWVKSRVMTLRTDVTYEDVSRAMDWYERRGMIERYQIDGRCYFWVPSFPRYQGNTSKEAESQFPPPPYNGNSGPTPDQGKSKSSASQAPDADADADAEENTNGADAPPTNLAGWQKYIQDSPKNRPAALVFMHNTLYPGRDPPDYGYIGRTAKTVGRAGRLAALMWEAQAHHPDGDVLRYCMGMAKNRKGGKSSGKKLSNLEQSLANAQQMEEEESKWQP